MGKGATGLEYNSELNQLESHKNYIECKPIKGESLLAYTLRYISNLVSPPQEKEESYNIECVTIKKAILGAHYKIERNWIVFKNKEAQELTSQNNDYQK